MKPDGMNADAVRSSPAMLINLNGIGPEIAAVLWSEGLYRSFANRKQVAAYAGLAPSYPSEIRSIWRASNVQSGRMKTIDEEITAGALAWMEKQAKAEQPFFLWYNSTAMHFRTHLADKNRGKSGQDDYSDRMVTHDEQVGELLAKLDELGIADNTIVMYSTDNGPQNDAWPDGANTPFRMMKDTNWEGGWRVPAFMRWPGKIRLSGAMRLTLPQSTLASPSLLRPCCDVGVIDDTSQ